MSFGKGILAMCLAALIGLTIVSPCGSCVAPPPCWSGFRQWFFGGDVSVDYHKNAVLGDNGVAWSYLYAFYELDPGIYRVQFDLKNDLSDVPYDSSAKPPYAFVDSFYASVFFRDDPVPAGCPDCYELEPLFDMDYTGVFNNHGFIGPSQLGPDWLHFSMVLENDYHYMAPVFELFDWNYISNDSHVTISNLCVTQVPIPSSLLLLGTALIWLLERRKRQAF